MIIESVSNRLIKEACSLKIKKYRDEEGKFLAQGLRLVLDACLIAPSLISQIFITEKAAGGVFDFLKSNESRFNIAIGLNQNVLSIFALLGISAEKVAFVSSAVMGKLSGLDTPQEIVAIIQKKPQKISGDHILFLDRVRDPGNLGTIIRTAGAAGYGLVLNDCVDVYSPKTVQSSMSAVLSVDFITGGAELLEQLKEKHYTVYAADIKGENLFTAKKIAPLCVIIGNEANGISDGILAYSDKIVTIPMLKTESLNAGVSAALAMYYFKEEFYK